METLYRKYRPLDFDTVVGQDLIVKTLKNQVAFNDLAHAYLFFGTRGTGKTTIAKIFARAVNCKNETDGNPCNECPTCKSSIDGSNLNIYEMDAASNRGVDSIRKINDMIAYPPVNGDKYKVFIIDEAHALTQEAMQAFLKILEEPPEYVIYILATTEPNKLAETILSRCQKYNFRRIKIEEIVAYLKKICDNENIKVDIDALNFIAEKSDGSMRESISKLDRCRSFTGNSTLTKELVLDILGLVSDEDFRLLAKSLNVGDIETALVIVNECIEKGKDIVSICNDFLWYLRNVLIAKDINEPMETLNITKSNFDKLKDDAIYFNRETLIYYIEEIGKTINSMKNDENRRVILETTLIRLAVPSSNYITEAVMTRLSALERTIENGTYMKVQNDFKGEKSIQKTEDAEGSTSDAKGVDAKTDDTTATESKTSTSANDEEVAKKTEMTLSKVTFDELEEIKSKWSTIIAVLGLSTSTFVANVKLVPGSETEPGYINVLVPQITSYEFLTVDNKKSNIEESLQEMTKKLLNKNVKYNIMYIENTDIDKNIVFKLKDLSGKIDFPIEDEV